MPFPGKNLKQMSARAVYAQNKPAELPKKGRGRPRKIPAPETKLVDSAMQNTDAAMLHTSAAVVEHTSIKIEPRVEVNQTSNHEIINREGFANEESDEEENIKEEKLENESLDEDEEYEDENENSEEHEDENENSEEEGNMYYLVSKENEDVEEESDDENSADDEDEDDEVEKETKERESSDDGESGKNLRYSLAGKVVTTSNLSSGTPIKQEVPPLREESSSTRAKRRAKQRERKVNSNHHGSIFTCRESINGFSNKKRKIEVITDNASFDNGVNNSSSAPFHQSTEGGNGILNNDHLRNLPYPQSLSSLVKLNKSSLCGNINADRSFHYLIKPLLPAEFFRDIYEKSPYHLTRNIPEYYKELCSVEEIHTMLKENTLEYNVHLDLVKYVKDERIKKDADGRAHFHNIWNDFKKGYSLRIRNPHAFSNKIWTFCSLLQEYFSCTAGCNVYLTPAKSQGFPPHYDDIDAFICQIEGSKHWRVYAPRNADEQLPRLPSEDFTNAEMGEPILEILLEAGDLLYLPRGYIHQACTGGTQHSLHLTFSCNQLNTWGDFLLLASEKAFQRAIETDVDFRHSVPKDFMNYAGVSVPDNVTVMENKKRLKQKLKALFKRAADYIDIDEAVDDYSHRFIRSSLAPVYYEIEKQRSVLGNGSQWKNGKVVSTSAITLDTEIQFIRQRAIRLVVEEAGPRIYHNLENSKDPQPVDQAENGCPFLDFYTEGIPAFQFMYEKYPEFIKVRDLPNLDEAGQLAFANSMYEFALIMTKEPLPVVTS